MAVLKVFFLGLAVRCASATFSQFFITPFSQNFDPLVQKSLASLPMFHHQPFVDGVQYNSILSSPNTYQMFTVDRTFDPFVQAYPIAPPLSVVVQNNDKTTSEQLLGKNLDISLPGSDKGAEIGFGYRTQYDDGATSMVVFLMGPKSQRSNSPKRQQAAARSLASDILDKNINANDEIHNALSNNISNNFFGALIETFPEFQQLQEPKNGVIHLFNYPVNAFPLNKPSRKPSSNPSSTSSSTEIDNHDETESIAVESSERLISDKSEDGNIMKEAKNIILQTKINDIENRGMKDITSSSVSNSSQTSSTSTDGNTEGSTEENSEIIESTTKQ